VKKLIKPSSREEAVYYSDFSGKCFGEWSPEVTLKINCEYGSKYDGSTLELHLSDEDLKIIFAIIKSNVSPEFKKQIQTELNSRLKHYDDSIQARDWTDCSLTGNSIDFLEMLLDNKQES